MVNYQLGKIYKIVDNTNNNIYVGSTCEPTLARRLSGHVRDFKNWKNGKQRFTTSFKIIENENYDIVLLELCPCETKDELHKRERYYIESLECVNRYIVGRTHKEYYNNNKEKHNTSTRGYHQANKEKIHEQKNRVCVCECGKTYTHSNKSQHQKFKFHQEYINSLQNKV